MDEIQENRDRMLEIYRHSRANLIVEAANRELVNEDLVDVLTDKASGLYNKALHKIGYRSKGGTGRFFNQQKRILNYARKGKFTKVYKEMQNNEILDFKKRISAIKVFNKREKADTVPFGMAIIGAFASTVDASDVIGRLDRIVEGAEGFVVGNGLNGKDWLGRFTEGIPTIYRDLISWILTNGGRVVPHVDTKRFLDDESTARGELDAKMIETIDQLRDYGWEVSPKLYLEAGFFSLICNMDLIATLRHLVELGLAAPTATWLKTFKVDENLSPRVHQYITLMATNHPFFFTETELHGPSPDDKKKRDLLLTSSKEVYVGPVGDGLDLNKLNMGDLKGLPKIATLPYKLAASQFLNNLYSYPRDRYNGGEKITNIAELELTSKAQKMVELLKQKMASTAKQVTDYWTKLLNTDGKPNPEEQRGKNYDADFIKYLNGQILSQYFAFVLETMKETKFLDALAGYTIGDSNKDANLETLFTVPELKKTESGGETEESVISKFRFSKNGKLLTEDQFNDERFGEDEDGNDISPDGAGIKAGQDDPNSDTSDTVSSEGGKEKGEDKKDGEEGENKEEAKPEETSPEKYLGKEELISGIFGKENMELMTELKGDKDFNELLGQIVDSYVKARDARKTSEPKEGEKKGEDKKEGEEGKTPESGEKEGSAEKAPQEKSAETTSDAETGKEPATGTAPTATSAPKETASPTSSSSAGDTEADKTAETSAD